MNYRKLKSNDRVAIAGKTGTGKTFLAKHLTRGLTRFVVFDSKSTLDDWVTVEWDKEAAHLLTEGEPVRARVLPPILKADEVLDFYNSIFKKILDAGDVTVYIDEAFAITENGVPIFLKALYTRGREFGVGVWASTQRPHGIPLFMLSEADHFYAFFLQFERDRKRMAEFMGEEVLTPAKDEHGFFYARSQDRHPVYYREFSLSKGQ